MILGVVDVLLHLLVRPPGHMLICSGRLNDVGAICPDTVHSSATDHSVFLNTSNVPNFSLLILLSFSSLTHPPTPLAGGGRLKVLLSTLLMRNLGRLRCCRGAANVRAPAAAGCGSLLVWLALTSFLSLVILVIVSPSLGSASTTSSCRCSLSITSTCPLSHPIRRRQGRRPLR